MTSDGKIDEIPSDARFRVLLKNDHEIIVYADRLLQAVSGRLRQSLPGRNDAP